MGGTRAEAALTLLATPAMAGLVVAAKKEKG